MPKYEIEIDGDKWTKAAAEQLISKYRWDNARFY